MRIETKMYYCLFIAGRLIEATTIPSFSSFRKCTMAANIYLLYLTTTQRLLKNNTVLYLWHKPTDQTAFFFQ